MISHRLPSGGLIDRAASLEFRFDGRALPGFAGDTLASALLASGVRLFGRSFKYHRPRGVFSAGPEEPNALVELGAGARREPNTRATTGTLCRPRSGEPEPLPIAPLRSSVRQSGRSRPLFAAGFYYKTFMWPARFWEKRLRAAHPPRRRPRPRRRGSPTPTFTKNPTLFCDVLVIGAGPAGLAAALAAGRAGARVVLCERDCRLGGRLLAEAETIDDGRRPDMGRRRRRRARRLLRTSASSPAPRVFGVYDQGAYARARARRATISPPAARHAAPAPLAHRRPPRRPRRRRRSSAPLVFGGNDRPGRHARRRRAHLSQPLRRRPRPQPRSSSPPAMTAGAPSPTAPASASTSPPSSIAAPEFRPATSSSPAASTPASSPAPGRRHPGGRGVRAVDIRDAAGRVHRLLADLLADGRRLEPRHLPCLPSRQPPVWNDTADAFTAGALPPGMALAGAAARPLDLRPRSPAAPKRAPRRRAIAASPRDPSPPPTASPTTPARPLWPPCRCAAKPSSTSSTTSPPPTSRSPTAKASARPSTSSATPRSAWRPSRAGPATSMGLALMAALTGRSIAETGAPTPARPTPPSPSPPSPASIAAANSAPRAYRPRIIGRPSGARFRRSRPLAARAMISPPRRDRLARPSRARSPPSRTAVGVCDVSTLGKIELTGPDAAFSSTALYVNRFSNLRRRPRALRPDAARGRLRRSTTAQPPASAPSASS